MSLSFIICSGFGFRTKFVDKEGESPGVDLSQRKCFYLNVWTLNTMSTMNIDKEQKMLKNITQ